MLMKLNNSRKIVKIDISKEDWNGKLFPIFDLLPNHPFPNMAGTLVERIESRSNDLSDTKINSSPR